MRYRLVNLGQQTAAPNMVLSKDFDSFYQTALGAANGIAAVARSKDLSDDDLAEINRQLGTVRDYTVPMAQAATCPPEKVCPSCGAAGQAPVSAQEGNTPYLVAGAALLAGLAVGAFLL